MEDQQLERESLGQRIKRLRKERGLSQVDLAKSCGVSDPWISQVEQDKVTPSASLLNDIADTFKISIRDLLQDEDKRMELVSRIKLVEVLLETNQPNEAETILTEIMGHPECSEEDNIKNTVYLSECRYQQEKYDEALDILLPLCISLESKNFYDSVLLSWIRNEIGKSHFQIRDFTKALYSFQKAYDYTLRFNGDNDPLTAKISLNLAATLRLVGQVTDACYRRDIIDPA